MFGIEPAIMVKGTDAEARFVESGEWVPRHVFIVGGRIKPRKFEPAGSHLGFEQRDDLAASRRQELSPSMVLILAWWTTSPGHAA